jgi:hypothetical protein
MVKDPTTGVRGAKPNIKKTRFKSAREELPELSKKYLEARNRQIQNRAQQSELLLARARNELIEKSLCVKQGAYLMVAFRQKILNLPSHAHKLVGLSDVNQIRKILREIAISALNEVKDLPNQITDPNWLRRLDEEKDGTPDLTP